MNHCMYSMYSCILYQCLNYISIIHVWKSNERKLPALPPRSAQLLSGSHAPVKSSALFELLEHLVTRITKSSKNMI